MNIEGLNSKKIHSELQETDYYYSILGISEFAYLQKAGEITLTGCLHNLIENNTITDFTYAPEDERLFLLDLYNATDGPNWIQAKGWRGNTEIHHCHWYGIECYKNSSYVKCVSLGENGLVGKPPNFWRFRNLQGICLSRNRQMTGNISDVVSSNMTRLRRLSISFTKIGGHVPWSLILQLHSLEKLQICCMNPGLKANFLPEDIGRLNKLQVLSVGENKIHDVHLPLSIKNLTKLWFLDLEYVKFISGNLSYFDDMIQLHYLHLTNCQLGGTLPKDFGIKHPNMIELRLYGNKLHGELHSCFLGFKKITQLSLGANTHLHGLLPTTLGKLETLQVLDVSENNFTGFAENMTFNKELQMLFIDNNINLRVNADTLLKALLSCKDHLRMLVAKNSGLVGEISSKLWSFDKIIYIDLSENNITGQIPNNGAYSMAYLFHLTLAWNNFTGDLRKSFFAPLKMLTYLDIRGNSYMKTTQASALNSYLDVSAKETIHQGTLICPTIKLTLSGGKAEMDPSYYGYALCTCKSGYYGFRQYCKPCMEGASCEVEASPEDKVVKGSVDHIEVKMTIHKGYWPCCGNFTNVTRMLKCSQEEKFDDEICSPSGKCKCLLNQVNGQLQTSCNTSCICRYGNKGRFCSQCLDQYYKKGSLCISCPEFRRNFPVVLTVCFVVCFLVSIGLLICFRKGKRLVLILMFFLAVALIVLHYLTIIPGWFFVVIFAVWILGLSGASEKLESFLCITVFFFQSLDAMFSDANIWPQTVVFLKYQITNAFNFDISQLTCSFSDADRPEFSFAVILLAPVTAIVLLWFLHGLMRITSCQCLCIPSSMCKRLTIQILLFLYFPITAKTFKALSPCEYLDGLSYLKDTPWLDCDGTSYNWLLALGFVSLAVFVLAVPFFVFAPLLYKYLDGDGNAVSDEVDKWMKPLYQEFKKGSYRRYFPLVFLARRLLLAVFLTVVPTTSCYQIMGITLLLVIFIAIILIYRPYEQYWEKFELETLADVVVSVVLLLSFVGLALLRVSPKFDISLVWLIVSMNCVVMMPCALGMFVLFIVNLWKPPQNAVQPQNVQSEYEQIPDGSETDKETA